MFDTFKRKGLAPKSGTPNSGKRYHWPVKNHTIVAWWDEDGREQAVFLPGLLDELTTIATIRAEFPDLLPSPLIWRFNKPKVKTYNG